MIDVSQFVNMNNMITYLESSSMVCSVMVLIVEHDTREKWNHVYLFVAKANKSCNTGSGCDTRSIAIGKEVVFEPANEDVGGCQVAIVRRLFHYTVCLAIERHSVDVGKLTVLTGSLFRDHQMKSGSQKATLLVIVRSRLVHTFDSDCLEDVHVATPCVIVYERIEVEGKEVVPGGAMVFVFHHHTVETRACGQVCQNGCPSSGVDIGSLIAKDLNERRSEDHDCTVVVLTTNDGAHSVDDTDGDDCAKGGHFSIILVVNNPQNALRKPMQPIDVGLAELNLLGFDGERSHSGTPRNFVDKRREIVDNKLGCIVVIVVVGGRRGSRRC